MEYDDFDYVELINILQVNRAERIFRDRLNPLEVYSGPCFRDRFRLSKETIRDFIMPEIIGDLHRHTLRNQSLTPIQQLCIVLRFYSSGSFHRILGDTLGMHRSTVTKLIHLVSVSIIRRLKHVYIRTPTGQDNLMAISAQFQEKCRFPGVIGAIDCTHVRIQRPRTDNPAMFVNRKGYYSLNCQMVCDSRMSFWNVVVRWPGSTHDSRIFENSNICQKLETGELQGTLLGDAGYACKPYLITPISRPNYPNQERFNTSQRQARGVIERAFGLLKMRWGVLGPDSRLRFHNLDKSMAVIVACAVLHNLSIVHRDVLQPNEPAPINMGNFNQFVYNPENERRGAARRQAIINQYFH